MALLEIIHLTGDVERRDLYKRQPMTIGSHSSCDLRIDEEGVEIMHCRISWTKDNWEAVAAGTSPFDLNGTPVQRAILKSGDTLRFGTVDVKFHGGATVEDTPPPESFGIKPTSEEALLTARTLAKQKAAEPKVESRKAAPPAPEKPKTAASDEQMLQSLEMLAFDSQGSGSGSKKKAAAADDDDDSFEMVEDDEPSAKPAAKPAARPAPTPVAKTSPRKVESAFEEVEDQVDELNEVDEVDAAAKPGVVGSLAQVLKTKPVRPGEQEPLKSRFVLFLLGGSVLLVIVGFAFYFIAFRRVAEREFDQAKALVTEGKFNQGIEALQTFVTTYPKHEKTPEAGLLIGLARIDQHLAGGSANYAEGVKQIRAFVSDYNDHESFESMKPELANRAGSAAQGAALLAGKTPKVGRPLLAVSRDARTLLTTYSPKEAQPTEQIKQIETSLRSSEILIRKFELNDGITASIKKAITDKKPMEALRQRRELLAQYPDYATDRSIKALLTEAMETERALVKSDTPNTAATTTDDSFTLPAPRTLLFHARSRTDQVSVNEIVWVLGKDCLYGVDTVTGLPVWRRLVGSDPAFFPVEEDSLPSLIYFDSDRDELVRIQRKDGALKWRQSLGERAAGKPLIDEGQIYITTVGGALLQIDLQTGDIASRLTFSQRVNGPVLIADSRPQNGTAGESDLMVVGDQDVVYTLTRRPLACAAVSYFAQKSQSVSAPLISMGVYAAFVENHSETSATLHLVKRDGDKPNLLEAASGPIAGMVVDESVIRGPDLFVPSTVERVSAFSVSLAADEPPLTPGPTFQVQGAKGSPIYLTPGPERQVWMSSSALRRLQLNSGTLQVDPKEVAIGISSQPNQHQGALLFNARRRPFTDAVTLTQTDRDTLDSEWQVMAGARILAVAAFEGDAPSLLAVNEGGATFRVTAADLTQPGFQTEYAVLLPVNKETVLPLLACALPDTQIAVVCGDPEPRIWIINRLGQIERQGTLPASPQAPPLALGKRIVVPLAGKLHVARAGQADTVIQDFQFPSGAAPPTWKQILAADDKTLIGLTESGELLQVRLEANPKPHLAEVARQPLPGPAVGKLAILQGQFAVACSTGDVFLFDAAKFEPLGKRKLEQPATAAAYAIPGGVLVETGDEALHCLNADATLTAKWQMKLSGSKLAGQPAVIEGALVLTFENGQVLRVKPDTGELLSEQLANGSLDSGPLKLGRQSFVLTWDGSMIPLTAPAAK